MARGKHTTIAGKLGRSVKWLESVDGVHKVVLGITSACRHKYSEGYIKVLGDNRGGFRARGYSSIGVVELFIRIYSDKKKVLILEQIEDKFGKFKGLVQESPAA